MIAIIHQQFEHNIANHITRFLEHPTAPMIRKFKECADLLRFDTVNDWHHWQTVYCLAHIPGSRRAYMTYGGGPEGGVVRLDRHNGMCWYVWHRNWGIPVQLVRIPAELTLVTKNSDGYEAIKLVMDDYDLGDDEYYLDDMEEANDEAREPEDESEADEEDIDTPLQGSDDENDDEDIAVSLNREMREEMAALAEQIRDNREQMARETTTSGIMIMGMLINQAEERIEYLRNHLAS